MEKEIGLVEDFFAKIGAIAIKLTSELNVGDTIRIKGHTTDITQPVSSIQIDRQPVQSAKPGDSIGIKITDRARKGDVVYKVLP